jgi:hypothetical protein
LGNDRATRLGVIKFLLKADHHLHEKEEKALLRGQLKELLASEPRDTARENTVDVMAFAGPPAH